MLIELMQFRLTASTSIDAFVAADHRVQTQFAYGQPGLLRRTTAHNDGNGEWVVIDHWRTAADADACAERWDHDEVVQAFMALVDRSSVRTTRYWTL